MAGWVNKQITFITYFFQNEINEDDLATFIIGSGAPFDNKAQIPKFLGMDKELWERILRLSTTKRFDWSPFKSDKIFKTFVLQIP